MRRQPGRCCDTATTPAGVPTSSTNWRPTAWTANCCCGVWMRNATSPPAGRAACLGEYPADCSQPPSVRRDRASAGRVPRRSRPRDSRGAEWLLRRWGQREALRQACKDCGDELAKTAAGTSTARGDLRAGPRSRGVPHGVAGIQPIALRRMKRAIEAHPHSFALSSGPVRWHSFSGSLRPPGSSAQLHQEVQPRRGWPNRCGYLVHGGAVLQLAERGRRNRARQWCYPEMDEIKEGMSMSEGYLERTGYRLPTEAEWLVTAPARQAYSHSASVGRR